ncbi:hypothetical protein PMKS-000843 [Pichia membranifaciens]|uniref:U3 small nucleolar ribonucleoprotein protein MPP10 n=1 Tax=Pichia membranifaciens TaxID=4926 RepID=A0A1Q2YCU6_9ASCO|nr:hypothetical protein PMKS-000843 [Pichia membranifaciens]
MSAMNLQNLINDPTSLFTQKSSDEKAFDYENLLQSLKEIVDPVIKSSDDCVLDEIYIDGLDATQVWGQAKLVFDGVERGLWSDLQNLKFEGDNEEESDEGDDEGDEEDEEEVPFGEMDENGTVEEENSEEVEDGEGDGSEIEEDEGEDIEEEGEVPEEEELEEESDDEEVEEGNTNNKSEDFGLNDEFFNLDDYKRQVLALEDADDLNDDETGEGVDLFADLSDDNDDDEMYTYDDFFDAQGAGSKGQITQSNDRKRTGKGKGKGKKGELKEEDYDAAYNLAQADLYGDEGEQEAEEEVRDVEEDFGRGQGKGKGRGNGQQDESKLSTFEKQQREIQKQIAELEAESIAEKKWTMKGEVSGRQRESDTLLEEDLEFDRTAKPVPVITQDVTESIEEIIKRRIVNQEFDEVPKRIISELNNFKPSKRVDVSEEKSSKSLAELYEDEYTHKTGDEEANEALKSAHDEISEMFKDVTYQLDSLYSSHFVPRPKEKLLDVRIQTSTIAMEDAQPLTMATGTTLAPQEVYKTGTKVGKDEVVLRSGVVMAKAELEGEDRQRLHRAKKRKQHMQSKDESQKKKKVETPQL